MQFQIIQIFNFPNNTRYKIIGENHDIYFINTIDFTNDKDLIEINLSQHHTSVIINGNLFSPILGLVNLKDQVEKHFMTETRDYKNYEIKIIKPVDEKLLKLNNFNRLTFDKNFNKKDNLINLLIEKKNKEKMKLEILKKYSKEEFIDEVIYKTKKSRLLNQKEKNKIFEILEKEKKILNKPNEKTKTNVEKKSIKHKPKQTTELLKKFKYNNDFGFKEMVHKPSNENYSFDDFNNDIKKAEKYFNTLKDIPTGMFKSINELIELMNNEGKDCFKETNEHPYLNERCNKISIYTIKKKYENLKGGYERDVSITQLIQNFKRNYRFGSEISEESILKDLIVNILNKQNYEDTSQNLKYEFNPKSDKEIKDKTIYLRNSFSQDFNDEAIFFTWVPNISNFLVQCINDILKHGNINGERNFASDEKEIEFSVKHIEDTNTGETFIQLVIFDKKSIVKKNKELFYRQIKDKSKPLISICNWKVETDFIDGEPHSINILPETKEPFRKIDKVNGLKHILTFYI